MPEVIRELPDGILMVGYDDEVWYLDTLTGTYHETPYEAYKYQFKEKVRYGLYKQD